MKAPLFFPHDRRARRAHSINILLALLAGATFLAPGPASRCHAATCADGVGPGGMFLSGPANDTFSTFAVAQIQAVNSATYNLFQGATAPGYFAWNNTAHTLTTPVMYDTLNGFAPASIGRSAPLLRPLSGSMLVGSPIPNACFQDTLSSYPSFQPAAFVFAPTGTREVLTEIQSLTLGISGVTNCGCGSPMLPPCPPGSAPNIPMVMAGACNPDLTLPAGMTLNKSLGLVQSVAAPAVNVGPGYTYDFPAQSFFDIFVEVNLPPGPAGTPSATAFPANGQPLYSDPMHPLIVQAVPPFDGNEADATYNPAVCGFPPAVFYIHGESQTVMPPALYFATTCSVNIPAGQPNEGMPYYSAGELLGYLVLAGHGTLTPCDPPTSHEAELIAAVLGTPNNAKTPPPIPWPYPNAQYLWTTSTYDSQSGTNFDGSSIDAVSFPIGPSALWMRNLSISNFPNPINLPTPGNSATYTNTNALATCQMSTDGTNYSAAAASGSLVVLITNTNTPSGNTTNYTLQVLQLTLNGSTFFGNFYLRQSATSGSNSFGSHLVEAGQHGGYVIGSFINLSLQISTDDATFYNAARTFHVALANPPCGAGSEQLHVIHSGSKVITWWRNPSYSLEGSATLAPTAWVTIPGTSPITNNASGPYKYFRLSCD